MSRMECMYPAMVTGARTPSVMPLTRAWTSVIRIRGAMYLRVNAQAVSKWVLKSMEHTSE
jgi:hypothetical protein